MGGWGQGAGEGVVVFSDTDRDLPGYNPPFHSRVTLDDDRPRNGRGDDKKPSQSRPVEQGCLRQARLGGHGSGAGTFVYVQKLTRDGPCISLLSNY